MTTNESSSGKADAEQFHAVGQLTGELVRAEQENARLREELEELRGKHDAEMRAEAVKTSDILRYESDRANKALRREEVLEEELSAVKRQAAKDIHTKDAELSAVYEARDANAATIERVRAVLNKWKGVDPPAAEISAALEGDSE